jgi:hypothetical protein
MKLDLSQSQLIYIAKGWFTDQFGNKDNALEAWYKKHYEQDETNWDCVWSVIWDLVIECLNHAHSSELFKSTKRNVARWVAHSLHEILRNSMPLANYGVGGPFGSNCFNTEETKRAQIRACLCFFYSTDAAFFHEMGWHELNKNWLK